MADAPSILIVDDEPVARSRLRELLAAFAALTRWYGPARVRALTTLTLAAGRELPFGEAERSPPAWPGPACRGSHSQA